MSLDVHHGSSPEAAPQPEGDKGALKTLGGAATQEVVTPPRRRNRRKVIAWVAAGAVGAGGAAVAAVELAGGKSSPSKATGTQAAKPPKATQPIITKPSPTSLPTIRTPETPAPVNPEAPQTKATAIKYTGQPVTFAEVHQLLGNMDVAVTSENMDLLWYSGINPASATGNYVRNNLLTYYQNEKSSAGVLLHNFNTVYQESDVTIGDGDDPHRVTANVVLTTDFDQRYGKAGDHMTYSFTVGHREVQLPNGSSEDIVTFEEFEATPAQ